MKKIKDLIPGDIIESPWTGKEVEIDRVITPKEPYFEGEVVLMFTNKDNWSVGGELEIEVIRNVYESGEKRKTGSDE